MSKSILFISILTGLTLGVPALGQEASMTAANPVKTAWTDPEIGALGQALSGSWKSAEPARLTGSANETVSVFLNVAPVQFSGVPNALYVELAREGQLNRPYRQAIWRLYRSEGKIQLQTLEFRRARGAAMQLAGLWAAPEAFPMTLTTDDVVATLNLVVDGKGGAWTGATAHAYPTFVGSASSMTSQMSLDQDALTVTDTGFNADGKTQWGGTPTRFVKHDPGVNVIRHNGGVTVVEYPSQVSGEAAAAGNMVSVHYIGFLEDGKTFDSSYERGTPFAYQYDRKLIDGWNLAMADAKRGQIRKLFIPSAMAYKEQGNPPLIPRNANLIFEVQVLDVVAPAPQASDMDQQAQIEAKKKMQAELDAKMQKAGETKEEPK